MSLRLTSEEIKAKFVASALLDEQIASIKEQFRTLYSLNENVTNETFLTENQHRWKEPSDDKNDILFARLEDSKSKLTDFYTKDMPNLKSQLDSIIFALNEIKRGL
jgi:hypothetical protein